MLNIFQIVRNFLRQIRKCSHDHPLIRFLIVFSLFITYLCITSLSHGFGNGILISLLTWSFFVFCTPIADAGFLVDFPVRTLTRIKMIYSEMMVWFIAMSINLFVYISNPAIYEKTIILNLFKHILSHPYPYWIIILLSAAGTFLSVYFGDEILDTIASGNKERKYHKKHIKKYKLILFLFIIVLVICIYYYLLNQLHIKIPLL